MSLGNDRADIYFPSMLSDTAEICIHYKNTHRFQIQVREFLQILPLPYRLIIQNLIHPLFFLQVKPDF